jgi:hypothetical protein
MYCKLDWSSNLPAIHLHRNKWIWCYVDKTEANLASARALAARCVRVIHAQCVLQFALLSRTLLRSSSNNEPSDPPYRIVFFSVFIHSIHIQWQTTMICWMERFTNKTAAMCIHATSCFIHIGATQSHRNICDCAKFVCVDERIEEIRTKTVMIHTQVHLRIPCYDFYFL